MRKKIRVLCLEDKKKKRRNHSPTGSLDWTFLPELAVTLREAGRRRWAGEARLGSPWMADPENSDLKMGAVEAIDAETAAISSDIVL